MTNELPPAPSTEAPDPTAYQYDPMPHFKATLGTLHAENIMLTSENEALKKKVNELAMLLQPKDSGALPADATE